MSAFEILRGPPTGASDNRKVFLFDIDNTLYRKSTGIGDLMQDYIREYIEKTLDLTAEEAEALHQSYYKNYGLAVEGLVRKNHINAMDYNVKVDDALPLETILKPDVRLQEMLSKIDTKKWKLWLCTNAYRNHGVRVVKLLGIEQFFEGITYCDYTKIPMICKPMPEFFHTCMEDIGIRVIEGKPHIDIYFIDDSAQNVDAAEKIGWKAIHIDEPDAKDQPEDKTNVPLDETLKHGKVPKIQYIYQLPLVCPELFE